MKLIVSHLQPDFDALAALALAQQLHPDGVIALDPSVPDRVAPVLAHYRDRLRLAEYEEIDLDTIEELIVVDTSDRARIGRFEAVLERCRVTLYDHHPGSSRPIAATAGVIEPVGSTVTLLVRILRARGQRLSAELASLALLGLHEDTGDFRYAATGHSDHEAAAYLHSCGATPKSVRTWLGDRSSEAQRAFGERVNSETRLHSVAGHTVAVAAFEQGDYLAEVAMWSDELLDRNRAEAALLCVGMEGRTLVFARSGGAFDVAAALRAALAGGGHPGAAFARSDLAPQAALERVLSILAQYGTAPPRAAELMSAPVTSVPADATVAEALGLLLRHGHNGLPVLDGDRIVGMVSRRDLDRARRHGADERPVGQIMRTPVFTAAPDTPLPELEALVAERGVGRIPIVAEDRLVGIVTRSDLLAARHPPAPQRSEAVRVLDRFPAGMHAVLSRVRAVVGELGGIAYLVGGTVRDGLLGTGLNDLDLAVEGVAAEAVAERLQVELGGSLDRYGIFGTCSLSLPSGLILDLAETRQEFYPVPGTLPEVTPSMLLQDLGRRDFTVNAMALRIEPQPAELIDPFDGRADLERNVLRVLHGLSFHEDPTRLLRGIRLAARLGFDFETATRAQAEQMVRDGGFERVSRARLRHELELGFAEPRVAPLFDRLAEFGAASAAFALSAPDDEVLRGLDELRAAGRPVGERSYLLALLVGNPPEAAARFLARYGWPKRLLGVRAALCAAAEAAILEDETLEAIGPAGRALLEVMAPRHAGVVRSFDTPPYRRKVRGRDVIDLGLSPGPDVGAVLRAVSRARAEGRVETFEQELDLARQLIGERDPSAGQE